MLGPFPSVTPVFMGLCGYMWVGGWGSGDKLSVCTFEYLCECALMGGYESAQV